jgi:site-specific DNA recombinase
MTKTTTIVRPDAPIVRCAIYTRKSTEEGLEQEFNSLDAQRESAEAYIRSQASEGWACVQERYDDGGFTGGNIERPALQKLLADIEGGKIDCVIVYKVDRLSRSLLDFARLMGTFDKHSISFVSVTQQFNTATSMGRLVLNVLLSFAQFEREIIGERIRDKIAAQRRKGKWTGGQPVLGYEVDHSGKSPKLMLATREAARVREIFNLYLTLGSLLPVVDELARRGWKNKRWQTKSNESKGGRPFDKGSLHALLTNPLYVGKIKYKTDIFDGEHPPIIDAETFRKVQENLQRNGRSGGSAARNRHGALLRSLLHCEACGRTMVHSFTCKRGKRYRYYTCTQAIASGRQSCPSGSLPAAEIERVVIDQIRDLANDPRLRVEVLKQSNRQLERDRSELLAEQRGIHRELARHHKEVRRLAVERTTTTAVSARLADLHDRVAQGEMRLAELRSRLDECDRDKVTAEDIEAAFVDFDNVWKALSPREQAQVLSLLVARVGFNVSDSTVTVSFHPSAIMAQAQDQLGGAA